MVGERYCTECGAALPEDATFCPQCGKSVADEKFCTGCGAELPEGSSFCPQCGRSVHGGAPGGGYGYGPNGGYPSGGYGPYGAQAKNGPSFAFLILIYGLFAILAGLTSGISLATMDLASFDSMMEMMEDYGFDMTGYTLSVMHDWGYGMFVLAISGVAAVVSYYYCRKAENWKYAVAWCGIASVLTLGMMIFGFTDGLFLCPIGLIITYMVYSKRDTFKS